MKATQKIEFTSASNIAIEIDRQTTEKKKCAAAMHDQRYAWDEAEYGHDEGRRNSQAISVLNDRIVPKFLLARLTTDVGVYSV